MRFLNIEKFVVVVLVSFFLAPVNKGVLTWRQDMNQDKTNGLETDVVIFPMPHREAAQEKSFDVEIDKIKPQRESALVIKKDTFA